MRHLNNTKNFEDLLKSLQSLEGLLTPYINQGAVLPSQVKKHVELGEWQASA